MNRCVTCRHWMPSDEKQSPKESRWGVCVWLTGIHASALSPIRGKRSGVPLETLEDFGCTAWERKVIASPPLTLTATERARMVEAGYGYQDTRNVEGDE